MLIHRNIISLSLEEYCDEIKEKPSYFQLNGVKFKVGDVIGEGTYSKVCLAQRKIGDRRDTLACKIISKRHSSSDFTDKFLPRELSILRVICHPNIVKLVEIVEHKNCIYVFMDYCPYGDLLDHIRCKGRLSEKRSKFLFSQIALAIEYLHSINVAHRDLKCENILLSERSVVKIADFGFGRFCNQTETGETEFSKTFCGSAAYAAPEIIQGRPYNPKMYDIWSIGCILYIMLTAEMPFDESDMSKLLKQQQNRSIRNTIKRNDKLSQKVKLLLRQLLEPDVKRRPPINRIVLSKWLVDGKSVENVKEFSCNIRYF